MTMVAMMMVVMMMTVSVMTIYEGNLTTIGSCS